MDTFFKKLKMIVTDPGLRKRIFFVLVVLVIFRLLSSIPIPATAGQDLRVILLNDQALGFLNLITGGGLSAISIMMLGVGPYITSSIIMQLLTMMSPKIKEMYHEGGDLGRRKFTQYSRFLTVPLAILQGYGLLVYLSSGAQPIIGQLTNFAMFTNVIIVAAGSIFLMWLGELLSEFGIGNGVSLIIFAGIVSSIPKQLGQLLFSFGQDKILTYGAVGIVIVLLIMFVIFMTEAERPINITYAKQNHGGRTSGGGSTYLPLRLNQAGVIPIIFALSILFFPQVIANALSTMGSGTAQVVAIAIKNILANPWVNGLLYFGLVFLFTYFYTAVTVDPIAMATNLQKNGAFILGIRPGVQTSEYLSKIITRITLVGATFLGSIAVLPVVMENLTDISSLAISGTALLIVVSVLIDLIKKIDAQIAMREY